MDNPDPVVECVRYLGEPQRKMVVALAALDQRKGGCVCPVCLAIEMAKVGEMDAEEFLAYAAEVSAEGARRQNAALS